TAAAPPPAAPSGSPATAPGWSAAQPSLAYIQPVCYLNRTYRLYVSSARKGSGMRSTSYYPVIMTADIPGSAAFYIAHFRFRALFESDWYVHLQSAEDERVNLALLD